MGASHSLLETPQIDAQWRFIKFRPLSNDITQVLELHQSELMNFIIIQDR